MSQGYTEKEREREADPTGSLRRYGGYIVSKEVGTEREKDREEASENRNRRCDVAVRRARWGRDIEPANALRGVIWEYEERTNAKSSRASGKECSRASEKENRWAFRFVTFTTSSRERERARRKEKRDISPNRDLARTFYRTCVYPLETRTDNQRRERGIQHPKELELSA